MAREGHLIGTTCLPLAGFLLMEDEVALTDLGSNLGQIAMWETLSLSLGLPVGRSHESYRNARQRSLMPLWLL